MELPQFVGAGSLLPSGPKDGCPCTWKRCQICRDRSELHVCLERTSLGQASMHMLDGLSWQGPTAGRWQQCHGLPCPVVSPLPSLPDRLRDHPLLPHRGQQVPLSRANPPPRRWPGSTVSWEVPGQILCSVQSST